MATATVSATKAKQKRSGLSYWMDRVLKECEHLSEGFDPDAVHDLRVALRRCRSMADALAEIDPAPSWRGPSWEALQKSGRKLFRRLGDLRDVHIMVELIKRLVPETDSGPSRGRILEMLSEEHDRRQKKVAAALAGFDTRKWKNWRAPLRQRSRLIRPDGLAAQAIALERLAQARALYEHAKHHRSAVAWHELRIGLKRFRYVVENFLPQRDEEWSKDLKRLQDLLGDVHDLDEFSSYVRRVQPPMSAEERWRWAHSIKAARSEKLGEFRSRINGAKIKSGASLWQVWSDGLPQKGRVQSAAFARLRATAKALDPDLRESRRLGTFAMQFYEALRKADLSPILNFADSCRLFRAAATLRGIGKSLGPKAGHKAAGKTIRDLPPPPGWTADEMARLALIVRYHRGAEPSEAQSHFQKLELEHREQVLWLAGVLRLAVALGSSTPSAVCVAGIEKTAETAAIVIRVGGYLESPKSAARISQKKHLLESVAQRPILIEPDALHALQSASPNQSSAARP